MIGHPALKETLAPILEMKDKVESLAIERLKYEGRDNDPAVSKPGGRFYNDAVGFAMHLFLFYKCYKCSKPYFAGGYQCQEANAPFDPEELVRAAAAAT
jgi:E3 ubiquitin-protein ligase MYCBP2